MKITYLFIICFFIAGKTTFAQATSAEEQLFQSLLNAQQAIDSNDRTTYAPYIFALNQAGGYLFDKGRYNDALPFLDEAVSVYKAIYGRYDTTYFGHLTNLASCYLEMRNLKMAEIKYLELAKLTYNNTSGKSRSKYGLALLNLGFLNANMGNNETAEVYYTQSKDILDTTVGEFNLDYISVLNNLCIVLIINKQTQKATLTFRNILRIYDVLQKTQYEIDVPTLLSIGKSAINVKNYDTAYYFLNKALNEFPPDEKTNNHYMDLLFSLGQLQWKRFGVTQEVIHYLGQIASMVRNFFIQNTKNLNEDDVLAIKSDLTNYHDVVYSLLTQDPNNEGLLASALNSQVFFNGITSKLFTKGIIGNVYKNTSFRIDQIKKELGNNGIAISFLRYRYWDKDPKDSFLYAAFLIRPGTQKTVFISLFDETSLKRIIINEENILKSGQDIYSSLYDQQNNINPKSAGIKKMIWDKLLPYIKPGSNIYYSLDGYLNDINMNALADGSIYFGDRYNLIRMFDLTEISNYKKEPKKTLETYSLIGGINYSATVDTSTPSKRLLWQFGNINEMVNESNRGTELFEETYENLSESLLEVSTIENMLSKNGKLIKTFLKDTNATKSNFLTAVQLQPEVLHISTHGFFYLPYDSKTEITDEAFLYARLNKFSSNPMDRSGLVFAKANQRIRDRNIDCMLTASEIKQLDLSKLQLVVLSGCETGRGLIGFGEGIFGLQRAFKMAGAKYILVSLYEVDVLKSREFMVAFYSNLLSKNKTIEEAYNETQKEIRSKDPQNVEWAYWVLLR